MKQWPPLHEQRHLKPLSPAAWCGPGRGHAEAQLARMGIAGFQTRPGLPGRAPLLAPAWADYRPCTPSRPPLTTTLILKVPRGLFSGAMKNSDPSA